MMLTDANPDRVLAKRSKAIECLVVATDPTCQMPDSEVPFPLPRSTARRRNTRRVFGAK